MSTKNNFPVDFSHRLVDGNHGFIDSYGLASEQTLAILHSLALQFECGASRLSDTLICSLIDAAINGVGDLKALVRALGAEVD